MLDPNHKSKSAGVFGMALFIASLTVLFIASVVIYLIVRTRSEAWPPPGAPRIPPLLIVNTIILLISSATMHTANSGIKTGRTGALKFGLTATTALGLAFLAGQAVVWHRLIALGLPPGSNLYAFSFYWLTGLHAAHVIGGIALMLVVTRAAFLGRYSKINHPGVTYAAMYWHFLDAVWIALFLLIFVFG